MIILYIASYGEEERKGIYQVSLDEETGALSLMNHIPTIDFPSYIIIKENTLYVALKNATKLNTSGGVASYSIKDNMLELNNNYASSGRSYTHLCVSKDNHYLFAANYHIGTTAAYFLENKRIIKKISVVHHVGNGPDSFNRQLTPHAHFVGFTPDQKYVYAVDLGSDAIVLYHYVKGELKVRRKHQVIAGSGPRHMIFSNDGRFAYLLNEISNTIIVYAYKEAHFTMLQVISTLPHHFKGESSAAAIRLSDQGGHLFVSNRGHDSIAMYCVNQESGKLYLLYMVHCGKNPRDFNIINDKYLVIASQSDNKLEVMNFDANQNLLEGTNISLEIPQPVCVAFKKNK